MIQKSDASEVIIKGSIHKIEKLIAQKYMVPPTEEILIQHSAIMKYICERNEIALCEFEYDDGLQKIININCITLLFISFSSGGISRKILGKLIDINHQITQFVLKEKDQKRTKRKIIKKFKKVTGRVIKRKSVLMAK